MWNAIFGFDVVRMFWVRLEEYERSSEESCPARAFVGNKMAIICIFMCVFRFHMVINRSLPIFVSPPAQPCDWILGSSRAGNVHEQAHIINEK